MSEQDVVRIHWSFWAISAFGLIWNGLACVNFFLQMNADMVASFPETHRAIIVGRPLWATAGFAIAVFGGALGCLLLLLRKSAAKFLLIVSLLGVVLTMVHSFRIAGSTAGFSPFEMLVMIVLPLVVAAFLFWYAKRAERKGWIS
ncbi:MAG: hypothetical protein OER56_17680 [Hyphomicrobiales bacterium]|nr:hypothetical protein [Hyphomicrobiales bacterium]